MTRVLIVFPSTGNAMGHELRSLADAWGNSVDVTFLLPSHFEIGAAWRSKFIRFPGSHNKIRYLFYQIFCVLNFRLWCKFLIGKFEVLHIYNAEGYSVSLIFALWAKILGMRIVVTVHDPDPHPGNLVDRLNALLRPITLFLADVLHFNSACFSRLSVFGFSGRQASRHIPLGSIHGLFEGGDTVGMKGNNCDILLLGRIEVYKGIDTLVEAHIQSGFRYKIKIVGRGPYDKRVDELIDGLPNIDFENRFVPDCEIADYFRGCRVVVLPYIQASQSSLPLLAAYWRRGLVCSALGGLVEDCADTNGVLVAPGNASALLEGIEKALKSPASLPGHRTYRHTATSFLELYREITWSSPSLI